ncbi:hypothetical protein FRC08_014329 [Ceratobasidium sp. 394]|nr:hypothetical protein FRC08_014329 [Ceratobasidium sp. 394]
MDGSNSSPRITDKRSSSRMDFAHPALASMRGEKFILQLVELVTLNKFVKLSKLSEPVELFKLGQLVLAMVLEVPVKRTTDATSLIAILQAKSTSNAAIRWWDNERRADDGRRTVNDGRRTMDDGRWTDDAEKVESR